MFELGPIVKVVLIALSVSPMPPFLPAKALKSGGNSSYVIGLLTLVSAISFLVIPVSFGLLGALFDTSLNVPLGDVERILATGILGPLILGMVVNRYAPQAAERGAHLVSSVATILLVVVLVPILFKHWPEMRTLIGDGTLVAIIFLTLVGLLVGHVFGGPRREDREVLALATCARHPAIAMAIVALNFPNATMVGPAVLLVLIVAAITTLPYEHWMRRTILPTPRRHRYSGVERRGRA
jgi:BASS family bile acid:Na+ symporter